MIKLNSLENIATIMKTKYGGNLYQMNFIFCVKTGVDSYFIFQEIQGMPIRRIVYHDSNNSVTFVAAWASWNNPYALVLDANYNRIGNWKDVMDRSRPYNSYIKIDGGFNSKGWESFDRSNKTEKVNKHRKSKKDVFVEFRIDKVERAIFNEWGFELYSSTISVMGFRGRSFFPYNVEGAEQNTNYGTPLMAPTAYISDSGTPIDNPEQDDINLISKVTWQGKSFSITAPVYDDDVSQGYGGVDLSSYWNADDEDEENDKFDEEIANMLLEDREEDDSVLDVGQKKINLYFDD